MHYFNIFLIFLIAIFILQNFLPIKGVKQISTTELKNELLNKTNQLIDVRTPGEYQSKHITGFNNIPLNELINKNIELSKDKETIVICQSGMRSKKACKMLKKMGFIHVTNVKGGISTWN